MNKEQEETRIEINGAFNRRISGLLKVVAISVILMLIAIGLSFLQPRYVADQIGIMWLIVEVFLFGTIAGLGIGNVQTEMAFKISAKKKKGG